MRPKLLEGAEPRYPPEAWDQDVEGDVVLLMLLNEEGRVETAEVASTPGFGLEIAALVAAKKLRFSPAMVDGRPVKVRIRYTFHFEKPEKAIVAAPWPGAIGACPRDERPTGVLVGRVLRRGSSKPISGAELYFLDLDEILIADEDGRFSKELLPGGYAIGINISGYYPFWALERVESEQKVEVEYHVERRREGRYRSIVWGKKGKAVVGRTSLAEAEIYEIPGTLGDPLRVVMLMPGVTSSVTGMSYPMIRGVLPGDTRYEVDGIQVPMLYHLLLGNSVINPRFTSGITFQPGGYSVEHGRFPGALIAVRPAPRPKERITAPDASLIQSSLFHTQPITEDLHMTAAARYGTLGLIIEALASDAVFRYWDYQSRVDYSLSDRDVLQLLAFGAVNQVGSKRPGSKESILQIGFHRAALRWKRSYDSGWIRVGVELGQEGFRSPPDDEGEPDGEGKPGSGPGPEPFDEGEGEREPGEKEGGITSANYSYLALRSKASFSLLDELDLRVGADAFLQDFDFVVPSDDFSSPSDGLTLGAYLETEWTPGSWTIMPGLRVDYYRYGLDEGPRRTGVDPRLAVGYDITDRLTAKASAGVHHGPPRVTLVQGPMVIGPIPGMAGVGLDRGLSRSIQLACGLELELPWHFEAALQGYYSFMSTGVDFSMMSVDLHSDCEQDLCSEEEPSYERDERPGEREEPQEKDDPIKTEGRSYGLELMLRRRLGDSVFGWITYSLSRSERDIEGIGTLPFAFDQTHVLNATVSWEVGRHWTLGATFHFHTGRPYTRPKVVFCDDGSGEPWDFRTCRAKPFSARLPSYWRIDARVQKREVFDTWYFDFYIDIINVSLNWETVDYEVDWQGKVKPVEFPIMVPMIGLRGQF